MSGEPPDDSLGSQGLFSKTTRPADRDNSGPGGWEANQLLGDFRLITPLGRGGMGAVWEAEQVSLDRRVALKLLFPHLSIADEALGRFHREANAAARLRHPAIVAVYEAGEADGSHYIAQELVPGGVTLAHVVAEWRKQEQVSSSDYQAVAELFASIAEALQVAHDAGVIHRDVKPGNILITEDGQPKVADFGLAKINDDLVLSRSGELAGTPFYMSPEQASGHLTTVDHRTDVFSLGATLYECLTLRRPFEGDTSQQVLEQVIRVEPPDPQRLRSRVPRDLSVICQKALEKRPDARYPSMAEFAGDLRRWSRDEPITARPPGSMSRIVKWTRRHPLATTTSMVVMVSVVVVAWLLHLRAVDAEDRLLIEKNAGVAARQAEAQIRSERDRALEAEGRARRQTYAARLNSARAALAAGDIREAHRRLAACDPEQRGWEWGHLSLVAGPSLVTMSGHEASVWSVAYTPGGRGLVSGSRDGTIRRWDLDTGEEVGRVALGGGWVTAVAVSKDGRLVAASCEDGVARLVDLQTERVVARLEGHGNEVMSVAFSPDGAQIVTASDRVHVWDTESGRQVAVSSEGERGFWTAAFSPDGQRIVTGGGDGVVRVWSVPALTETFACRGHAGAVTSVSFDGGGEQIVSASHDGVARTWHAETGVMIHELTADGVPLWSAAFSPDGDLVVTGADDGTVRLWDASQGQPLEELLGHEGAVLSVAFGPDGQMFASSDGSASEIESHEVYADRELITWSHPGSIRLWSRGAHGPSVTLREAGPWVNDVAVSPSGDHIVVGAGQPFAVDLGLPEDLTASAPALEVWTRHADGFTRVWDVDRERVMAVGFSSDGRSVVALGGDGVLERRDSAAGAELDVVVVDDRAERLLVNGWGLRGSDGRLAAFVEDGTILVVDGDAETPLTGHSGRIHAVAWSPTDNMLASAAGDGTLRLWNVEAATAEILAQDESRFISQLRFSPDGRFLAQIVAPENAGIYSAENTISIWDVMERSVVLESVVVDGSITSLAFSPDGRCFVTGAGDPENGSILVWDVMTGEHLASLTGHDGFVTALRYSADGRLIVSGSGHGQVRVWFSGLQ
jgi:WD40 repeat protein